LVKEMPPWPAAFYEPFAPGPVTLQWQEWRDSNPRPSVLETDALPTELHSSGPEASGDIAVSNPKRK
jgi:hypothetical protein